MAGKKKAKTKKAKEKLFTLTEVAKKTGISMPTLQRYKKRYQSRLPSVGQGRRQRYPASALPVFREIKKENLERRGRPRGKAAAATTAGRPARGKKRSKSAQELLTLTEIGRRTGISYPTLVRYVKVYRDEIPHEGRGRKRRFPKEAVKVFRELRQRSKRGRKKKSEGTAAVRVRQVKTTDRRLAERIRALERSQAEITRQLDAVIETLKKPLRVTISSD